MSGSSFEEGNHDHPIWSGCFWGSGEVPVLSAIPDTKLIKTGNAMVKLDDHPGTGGVTIETNSNLKIVMNASGIEISSGTFSVKLTPKGSSK